jgi:aryl-alcohol dehydrogenase-like predicted oxidoreductase
MDAHPILAGLPGRRRAVGVKVRRLGATGPELSRVGFGAWAIGGPWRFGWGDVDDDDSVAAIRHAVELGINWVDTAAVYGLGHSEEVVGRALAPYRVGEDVFVFTKCGRRWHGRPEGVIENDLRPASIREECEDSLRRLGVERIDLYQFHWPDWMTGTALEDSWETMAELVDEGKVRWIGVANFDVEQLALCEAIRHVDSVQPPLSLLSRGARETVLPWAAEHGTGVIVYSPMASGLLTGAFDRDRIAQLDADDWRRESPAFREPALERNLDLVEKLRAVAAQLGTTIPELAVAWTLAQVGVTGAIVGARLPRHVDGWVGAPDLELSVDALSRISDAIAASGAGTDEPPQPPPHVVAAAAAREEHE